MTDNETQTTITLEAADRFALLQQVVERLRALLGADSAWDHGATVTPWQATTPVFDELPGRMITAMLDAAEATGERLVDLELGGFLETDTGPRAWGMVAIREGELDETLRVAHVTVTESDGAWRLEATVQGRGGGT